MAGAAGVHTDVGSFKGMLKCQQFINDAAKSPNVALRIIRLNIWRYKTRTTEADTNKYLILAQFRRHVKWRACC
jgi:hypothetical protein